MRNNQHTSHSHAGHSGTKHEESLHRPPKDLTAYNEAFESARPDPECRIVHYELNAREVEWEFVPGRRTRAWGFDGQIPGPTIEAQVGDVVEIKLTNSLPEPTAIHWHGLRIPSAMDGTEMVQYPVEPGDSFVYRFKVPDAGTFWYHPHVNETVQLERGLYGAFIVRGSDEPQLDAERVLMLDDTELDRNGQIKPPGWWIEKHNGREGKVRLVNGVQEPQLTIAAGQIERWRVINAASARYVLLSIGGKPFRILGTDGGLIAEPVAVTEVLIAPAERVDLAIGPFTEGENLQIDSLRYRRGSFGKPTTQRFGTLRVGSAAPSRATVPAPLRHIEPLATGAVTPNREVRLGWKLSRHHGVRFVVNKEAHHRAEPVRVGELQVWDIVNQTPMDHPWHLHGFFFQVLDVNGQPPAFLAWKDTVNIPARGNVRIAWIPDDRPGEWMYHCHILEHHAGGMMAHFEVIR